MNPPEQATCGKGLAENSVLPAMLGDVIAGMAKNLETHMKALDLTDQNSRAEFDAYQKLVKELQQAAAQLQAIANQMKAYRDLPMGKHNEEVMTQPEVREVFEAFVDRKQALLSLLNQTTERDNKLLETMCAQSR